MTSYDRVAFPILRHFDAEMAHRQTLRALELAQRTAAGRSIIHRIAGYIPLQPVEFAGLTFPNVLGLAAGFDKDARAVEGLSMLGFGHIEVGTLTPRPQAGNPEPRVFRLVQDGAIINRMGFPNAGVKAVLPSLRQLAMSARSYVMGVSLGKQKETTLEEANNDYLEVMTAVYTHCDYLAINISSPNTPGLRELQGRRYLEQLLSSLKLASKELATQNGLNVRPILIKIAPDLTMADLDEILEAVDSTGVDGIIATNTTLQHDALIDPRREEVGGLSGLPLRERSTAMIAHITRRTNHQMPIIGVGGIATVADICAKLDAGATLVQLYTSLVYGGPGLPGRLLRELAVTPRVAAA